MARPLARSRGRRSRSMQLSPIALALALLAAPSALAWQENPRAELRERIAAHPLLMRTELEAGEACEPYLLLIEKPRKAGVEIAAEVDAFYAPWLARLARGFMGDFVTPLALERKSAAPLYPVVVLESARGYANAARHALPGSRDPGLACTLADPRALVTFHDSFVAGRAPELKRFPVLREAAWLMFEDFAPDASLELRGDWYLESLASYLAAHAGDDPAVLETPRPHAPSLELLRELAEAGRADVLLFTTREIVTLATPHERAFALRGRAREAGLAALDEAEAQELFDAETTIFQHFLQQGAGGRYRDGARAWLRVALRGKGGEASVRELFEVDDPARLDAPFRRHLNSLLGADLVEAAPEVDAQGLAIANEPVHAELFVVPTDARERLGLALGTARLGDLDAALAALEEALEAGQEPAAAEPELAARIARERGRMAALVAARDALFEDSIESRRKLHLQHGEVELRASVARVADGTVFFHATRGPSQIATAHVSPWDLAENFGPDPAPYGPAWIGAYARLLGAAPGWDAGLGAAGEAAELRDDARRDMGELLLFGEAAARLNDLAFRPLPEEAAAGAGFAERIGTLVARFGAVRPVRPVLPTLRRLATRAWEIAFEEVGLAGLLAVAPMSLGEGRVRLLYELDDQRELRDFARVEGYLAERREAGFDTPPEREAELAVRDGDLVLRGSVCLGHVLALHAPLVVRYELEYGRPRPGKELHASFLLGLCDDGAESLVGARDVFDLEAIDAGASGVQVSPREGELEAGRTYRVELAHDGREVALAVDGEARAKIASGPRRAGRLLLWVHSEVAIAVKRIEVEGRIDEGELRARWVEQRLAEAGF